MLNLITVIFLVLRFEEPPHDPRIRGISDSPTPWRHSEVGVATSQSKRPALARIHVFSVMSKVTHGSAPARLGHIYAALDTSTSQPPALVPVEELRGSGGWHQGPAQNSKGMIPLPTAEASSSRIATPSILTGSKTAAIDVSPPIPIGSLPISNVSSAASDSSCATPSSSRTAAFGVPMLPITNVSGVMPDAKLDAMSLADFEWIQESSK